MAEDVAAAREAAGQDSAWDATKPVFTIQPTSSAECYKESIDSTMSFYELSIKQSAKMPIIPVVTSWSQSTAGSPDATLTDYISLLYYNIVIYIDDLDKYMLDILFCSCLICVTVKVV